MTSLQSLAQIYTIALAVAALLLIAIVGYRLYRIFIQKAERHSSMRLSKDPFPKLLKLLFGLSMLLLLLSAPFYLYIASVIKPITSPSFYHLFAVCLLLTLAFELLFSFTVSEKLIQNTFKKVILTIAVVIALPLSLYLISVVPSMFEYPEETECIFLDLPVQGPWQAGHAGGNEIVNYHCALAAQEFAMDIVRINDEGRFFRGDGTAVEDFYTFGENIYAPADGIILHVVDTLPNEGISFFPKNQSNPAGNHVVIELEKEKYLFLAHLDSASVTVRKGDSVRKGDIVGKAGNSGNTSWPHLHMHIQDKPFIDNATAKAFPYRFKKIKKKRWLTWTTAENDFLVRNDVFEQIE